MTTRPYDVAVAYRVYPRISKTPAFSPDDKYTLTEICLRSFKLSLGGIHPKVWAILDSCPSEYNALFLKYFDAADIEFVPMDRAGNAATFLRQIQILLDQKDSNLVYLAEDDYFYRPNGFQELVHYIDSMPGVHFVSPYDHLDYYMTALHDRRATMAVSERHHWRTAAATCLTFMTTKAILRKTAGIFRTYARRNYDSSIWLSLTKHSVYNPLRLLKLMKSDRDGWKIFAKAWFFNWRQICLGKKWNLWVPIPTIATHVESTGLAPTVDWPSIFGQALDQLETLRGKTV